MSPRFETQTARTAEAARTVETALHPTPAQPARPPQPPPISLPSSQVEAAYRVCRDIARRQAKNFYYAFLALPRAKHNAICAVYAFMRHADDLSDDESLPRPVRRENLRQWRAAWHAAAHSSSSGDPTFGDPVFVALNDARRRFGISLELLDQLIDGTAMDLAETRDRSASFDQGSQHEYDTYKTFADLYRYCYLVASVVGLVCIRIFEYSDPEAERLAEELGIAFQLTNILRDIREDAERGRIYLPLEDLAAHAVQPAALTPSPGASPHREVILLLAFEAARAESFYASGKLLMPMLNPDSRPALWVLMTTYHRLLQRIRQANYDVFSARIALPAYEKLAILARGLLGIARYRIFGGR